MFLSLKEVHKTYFKKNKPLKKAVRGVSFDIKEGEIFGLLGVNGAGKTTLSSLFLRFINPVFMFGGYFFSWHTSYEFSPTIAYCLLINPMIYVMEGMRAASLGQAGYLPFWGCFFALWGYIIVLGTLAVRSLKKRLDCV